MATTLAQALSNYNTQYLNALASKSKRRIEVLDQGWQQINNYWDIYLQATAEGDTSTAASAITGITGVLGGVIDASVVPNISPGANVRKGIVSVTPGLQKIDFSSDIGTAAYKLDLDLYTTQGIQAGFIRGVKYTSGFDINPSFSGTLEYRAEAI